MVTSENNPAICRHTLQELEFGNADEISTPHQRSRMPCLPSLPIFVYRADTKALDREEIGLGVGV